MFLSFVVEIHFLCHSWPNKEVKWNDGRGDLATRELFCVQEEKSFNRRGSRRWREAGPVPRASAPCCHSPVWSVNLSRWPLSRRFILCDRVMWGLRRLWKALFEAGGMKISCISRTFLSWVMHSRGFCWVVRAPGRVAPVPVWCLDLRWGLLPSIIAAVVSMSCFLWKILSLEKEATNVKQSSHLSCFKKKSESIHCSVLSNSLDSCGL